MSFKILILDWPYQIANIFGSLHQNDANTFSKNLLNFLISILKLEQDGDKIRFLWGSAAIKRQNKKVEHVLWISYMAQL